MLSALCSLLSAPWLFLCSLYTFYHFKAPATPSAIHAMELSSRVSEKMLLLNDLPTEKLRSICKYFLQALVTSSSSTEVDLNSEYHLCALSSFLLEAGKLRFTTETVRLITSISHIIPKKVDSWSISSKLKSRGHGCFLANVSKQSYYYRKTLVQRGICDEVSVIICEVYSKYHTMIFEHMDTTGTNPHLPFYFPSSVLLLQHRWRCPILFEFILPFHQHCGTHVAVPSRWYQLTFC